ncbi:MAG: hypothetical protein WA865_05885 [Spirulinaceae cyanobacterium]
MTNSEQNESDQQKNISERLKQALTILREIEEEISSKPDLAAAWERVDDYLDICQVNLVNALSVIELQQQPTMIDPTPIEEAVAELRKQILEAMQEQGLAQPTEEKLVEITVAQIHWLIAYLANNPDVLKANITSLEQD